VGRQENLAMHVTHFRLLLSERDVQRRVVDVILEALVESDDDVDRRAPVCGGEIARERAGGDRELLHAPFDEITRGGGLRKNDELGLGIELRGLRDDGTNPGDILRVLALGGSKLREGDPDVRHCRKIRREGTLRDGKGRFVEHSRAILLAGDGVRLQPPAAASSSRSPTCRAPRSARSSSPVARGSPAGSSAAGPWATATAALRSAWPDTDLTAGAAAPLLGR